MNIPQKYRIFFYPILTELVAGEIYMKRNEIWGCHVNVHSKMTLISQKGRNFGAGSEASTVHIQASTWIVAADAGQ